MYCIFYVVFMIFVKLVYFNEDKVGIEGIFWWGIDIIEFYSFLDVGLFDCFIKGFKLGYWDLYLVFYILIISGLKILISI